MRREAKALTLAQGKLISFSFFFQLGLLMCCEVRAVGSAGRLLELTPARCILAGLS